MRKNINKLASEHIEKFLIKVGRITVSKSNGFTTVSYDLFENMEDRKKVIALLKSKNLDVFKRGTKEPAAIEAALEPVTWDDVKDLDPNASGARSMFD